MRTTSRSDREHVTRDNLRSFPAHFARLCVIPAAATDIRERGLSLRSSVAGASFLHATNYPVPIKDRFYYYPDSRRAALQFGGAKEFGECARNAGSALTNTLGIKPPLGINCPSRYPRTINSILRAIIYFALILHLINFVRNRESRSERELYVLFIRNVQGYTLYCYINAFGFDSFRESRRAKLSRCADRGTC